MPGAQAAAVVKLTALMMLTELTTAARAIVAAVVVGTVANPESS
jgi:hypothetical protein